MSIRVTHPNGRTWYEQKAKASKENADVGASTQRGTKTLVRVGVRAGTDV
jgi:hypothetical protein